MILRALLGTQKRSRATDENHAAMLCR